MNRVVTAAAAVILILAGRARADVVTAPIDVVGDDQANPKKDPLDDPSFVTVVNVDERRGETISAAEALAETVGVTVKSLGGLGSFASVSLRGAPSGETQILLDGVPVSRLAASSFDLGTIDLRDFGEADVYRGGVPLDLGGAALGGAVNFVTRLGEGPDGPVSVEVGGGSWLAREARISWGRTLSGGGGVKIGIGYTGAKDDFSFYDDNGTPLTTGDDFTGTRKNNGYDQVDLFERARIRFDKTTLEGGARLTSRSQGVPGPSGASATDASLGTLRAGADFAFHRDGKVSTNARVWVLGERINWSDPKGQISLSPESERSTSISTGLGLAFGRALGTHQLLGADLDGTFETFSESPIDVMTGTANAGPSASGTRAGGAVSLGDQIVLGRAEDVVLEPAVRLDLLATRGAGATMPGAGVPSAVPGSRDDVYASPRLGARWKVTDALSLKGNVGRYFRPPTVLELFGDQGFVIGNPQLVPETGTTGDVGFVFAPPPRGKLQHVVVEYAFFVSRPHDLIAMLPTSGRTIRARNLGDADIAGHELAVSLEIAPLFKLTANYTFTGTEQRSPLASLDGKQLPGRPQHEANLRADVVRMIAHKPAGAWLEATLATGNFLDEGNVEPVPPRALLGAGVKYEPMQGLAVTVEAKNLLDERVQGVTVPGSSYSIPRAVSDVLGYPLPGRSFYTTVSYSF
jgi:iron complex outermembrane receptor protein